MRKVKWDVKRGATESGAPVVTGTYGGRGGLAGAMTGGRGSRTAQVESVALGSQLTFAIGEYDEASGRCTCVMNLASRGTRFGLTADAGFFRSYMNDVAKQLRSLDSDMQLVKSG
ncbi:hypothetical protein GCM10023175_00330 [Pseudonocardia xishanensis]|uniref:Uncharacterized protein n=1 Tax=Pseudonocardia xishanensis TaxID=630995 RepID=A0ABP8RBZ8_9PSEU